MDALEFDYMEKEKARAMEKAWKRRLKEANYRAELRHLGLLGEYDRLGATPIPDTQLECCADETYNPKDCHAPD